MIFWEFSLKPAFFFLQLDSLDEQAAAIRRELEARREKVSSMEKDRRLMPKFVLKDMEGLYIEEMSSAINLLKVRMTRNAR